MEIKYEIGGGLTGGLMRWLGPVSTDGIGADDAARAVGLVAAMDFFNMRGPTGGIPERTEPMWSALQVTDVQTTHRVEWYEYQPSPPQVTELRELLERHTEWQSFIPGFNPERQ